MKQAIFNNEVIAESDNTHVVDSYVYFPEDSVKKDFLKDSDHTSVCPYKGNASYYHVSVNGKDSNNAAWTYKNPKEGYEKIQRFIAFWKDVKIA